jgi:hypothetical protein
MIVEEDKGKDGVGSRMIEGILRTSENPREDLKTRT